MVAVNHMNHDIAKMNGSDSPMLPGSFLYEKEPGYEAIGFMPSVFTPTLSSSLALLL